MRSIFPNEHKNIVIFSGQRKTLPEIRETMEANDLPQIIYPTVEIKQGLQRKEEQDHTTSCVEIMVLEDSESDLGIVNHYAAPDHVLALLALVERFLHWAENKPVNKLYHGINEENLPDCFDYQALKKYLLPLHEDVNNLPLLDPVAEDWLH